MGYHSSPVRKNLNFKRHAAVLVFGIISFLSLAGKGFAVNFDDLPGDHPLKATYSFSFSTQNGKEISVRPFLGTDVDKDVLYGVVNHSQVAIRTCYGKPWDQIPGKMEETYANTVGYWKAFVESEYDYLCPKTHLIWIAEHEGEPVARGGFANRDDPGRGVVSALFLHITPEFQKQGIATVLLAKLFELFPGVNPVAFPYLNDKASHRALTRAGLFPTEDLAQSAPASAADEEKKVKFTFRVKKEGSSED